MGTPRNCDGREGDAGHPGQGGLKFSTWGGFGNRGGDNQGRRGDAAKGNMIPAGKTVTHRRGARAYQERHKSMGLCILCTMPAQKGQVRCTNHVLLNQQQGRRRRARLCAMGLCTWCGQTATVGRLFCEQHLRLRRATAAARLARRHRQGRCTACGAPAKGYRNCAGCRLRNRQHHPSFGKTRCSACRKAGHNWRTCPVRLRHAAP